MKICPNCQTENFDGKRLCKSCNSLLDTPQISIHPNKTNVRNLSFIISGVLFLLVGSFLIYFYATPYLSLYFMRKAAVEKDAATFSSYIDFPKFRENLKAELNAKVVIQMQKETNPFAQLGGMLAPGIINNMVDAFFTPAGIEQMMREKARTEQQSGMVNITDILKSDEKIEVDYGYTGINEFGIKVVDKTTGKEFILLFERHYLVRWRLVNLKFDL
jgi:hypothetical protein